jgi:hypothetical protein
MTYVIEMAVSKYQIQINFFPVTNPAVQHWQDAPALAMYHPQH